MVKRLLLFGCLLYGTQAFSQSVIFLHHSTGAGVYTEGNVAAWIANYNTANGTSYQITERAYPDTPYPWENYPYDYWNLWINNQCSNSNLNIQCLGNIVQSYDVVIYKHCFPGADILPDDGNPSVSSSIKTLANYKLQYRALRALMDQYPQKKFIVWTLAPLHRLATSAANASRAKQFVDWVKSTWLTEDGKSHPNIYIFDFYGLVAETNSNPVNGQVNCLRYDYEGSHTGSDSHPNTLANQTVGPLFAQFIVNTIKDQLAGIERSKYNRSALKIYPNPASGLISIDFSEVDTKILYFDIFNLEGKLILHRQVQGENKTTVDINNYPAGTYLIKAKANGSEFLQRFTVLAP